MTIKRLILTLSASVLATLLIWPVAASAQGPRFEERRDWGRWSCERGQACSSYRRHRENRGTTTVSPPVYGAHAIRGYAPSHPVVVNPPGPRFRDRGSRR